MRGRGFRGSFMRRLALRLVLAALTAVLVTAVVLQDSREGTSTAEAHHAQVSVKKKQNLRPGCHRHYPIKRFYIYSKARYTKRTQPLTRGQKTYLKHVRMCLANKKKSKKARRYQQYLREKFRMRLAYYRVTPYVCSNGTRWAIPCYIIACESGYSWSAYNGSSGARGPYQFLGWDVPWPVDSRADQLAHHRMGAYLWNGGRGRSHWVC